MNKTQEQKCMALQKETHRENRQVVAKREGVGGGMGVAGWGYQT